MSDAVDFSLADKVTLARYDTDFTAYLYEQLARYVEIAERAWAANPELKAEHAIDLFCPDDKDEAAELAELLKAAHLPPLPPGGQP